MSRNPFTPQTGTVRLDGSRSRTDYAESATALLKAEYHQTPLQARLYNRLDAMRMLGIHFRGIPGSKCGILGALLCRGPSFCGKSSTAKRYAMDINAKAPEGKIPVVYVSLSDFATPKKVLQNILENMGDITAHSGNAFRLMRRIIRQGDELGVELIIVDELHHLVRSNDHATPLNALKAVIDSHLCAWAFIGTDASYRMLTGKAEMANRVERVADMRKLGRNKKDIASLECLLLAMNASLLQFNIFQDDSDFIAEDVVLALMKAADGAIGIVALIIQNALGIALRRHASRVERYDLCEAIDTWAIPMGRCTYNPFVGG